MLGVVAPAGDSGGLPLRCVLTAETKAADAVAEGAEGDEEGGVCFVGDTAGGFVLRPLHTRDIHDVGPCHTRKKRFERAPAIDRGNWQGHVSTGILREVSYYGPSTPRASTTMAPDTQKGFSMVTRNRKGLFERDFSATAPPEPGRPWHRPLTHPKGAF